MFICVEGAYLLVGYCEVKIKLSPIIFNGSLSLFSGTEKKVNMELLNTEKHDHDVLINTYKVNY